MFENIERDADERGQVGIGTLIVFIALVLVAAIAAGVLINTAGFLQNQAESTGQESTNQVSDRIQVESVTGIDSASGDDGQIDKLELTLSLAPGANPVDVEDATMEYIGSSASTFPGDDDGVSYNKIVGTGSDASLLEESDNQVVATLDLTDGDISGTDLDAGDSAELTITTKSGGSSTVELTVPDPDGLNSGNSAKEAVSL